MSTPIATPSELAALAVALYAQDHRPGDPPDDRTYEDYLTDAWDLLQTADQFLLAREREQAKG